MTISFVKTACGLLIAALATPSTLAHVAGDPAGSAPSASGIRASMSRAADALASADAASPAAAKVAAVQSSGPTAPLTAPRPSRAKKSMGTAGVVMILVGTAAGIAGTYYMIKTMKDVTKTGTGQ